MTEFESRMSESAPIARRLRQLADIELRLNSSLIPKVDAAPPNLVYFVKLPTSLREIVYLYEIRELLPVTIRVSVEDRFVSLISKLVGRDGNQLAVINHLRDKIRECSDPRWIDGRATVEVLKSLKGIRLNLIQPRKPKKTQRRRGYADHGSRAEISQVARRQAAAAAAAEEERQNFEQTLTNYQLTLATELLAAERRGADPAECGEAGRALLGDPPLPFNSEKDALFSPCGLQDFCATFQAGKCHLRPWGDPGTCQEYKVLSEMFANFE